MKKIKRPAYTGRIFLEVLGWVGSAIQIMAEEKARGQYNLMTGIAVSPFDIMSFIFRDKKLWVEKEEECLRKRN